MHLEMKYITIVQPTLALLSVIEWEEESRKMNKKHHFLSILF